MWQTKISLGVMQAIEKSRVLSIIEVPVTEIIRNCQKCATRARVKPALLQRPCTRPTIKQEQ